MQAIGAAILRSRVQPTKRLELAFCKETQTSRRTRWLAETSSACVQSEFSIVRKLWACDLSSFKLHS